MVTVNFASGSSLQVLTTGTTGDAVLKFYGPTMQLCGTAATNAASADVILTLGTSIFDVSRGAIVCESGANPQVFALTAAQASALAGCESLGSSTGFGACGTVAGLCQGTLTGAVNGTFACGVTGVWDGTKNQSTVAFTTSGLPAGVTTAAFAATITGQLVPGTWTSSSGFVQWGAGVAEGTTAWSTANTGVNGGSESMTISSAPQVLNIGNVITYAPHGTMSATLNAATADAGGPVQVQITF